MTTSHHYQDMKVVLERDNESLWTLYALSEGDVVSQQSMDCDEASAMIKAATLASWFGAELIVRKAGA